MSLKSLTYDNYYQFKERKKLLERLINSYTIWGMTDPPLKSKEEIEAMKNLWRAELTYINQILNDYKDKMIGALLLEEEFEE